MTMSWGAEGAYSTTDNYQAAADGGIDYLSSISSGVVGSSFQPVELGNICDLDTSGSYVYNCNQVDYSQQNPSNLLGSEYYQQQLVNGGGTGNLDGGVYSVSTKHEGESGYGLSSFENSLTDISNYPVGSGNVTGIDSWIGGGVNNGTLPSSSNWLQSFGDVPAENYGTSAALSTSSVAPSLSTCSTSLYNFYDDDERECQKDLDEIIKLGIAGVDGASSASGMGAGNEEKYFARKSEPGVYHQAAKVENSYFEHDGDDDDEEKMEDDEDESSEQEDDDEDEENKSQNGSAPKAGGIEKQARPFRSETCSLCNISFPQPNLFEKHMLQVHKEPTPYPCFHADCDKKFAKFHQRTQHDKVHDPNRYAGEGFWECGVCDKVYHVRCSLYQHWRSSHPDMNPAIRKKMVAKAKSRMKGGGVGVVKRVKATSASVGIGVGVTQNLKKLHHDKRRRKSLSKLPEDEEVTQAPVSPPPPLSQPNTPLPLDSLTSEEVAPEFGPDCRPGHYPCSVCGKVLNMPFNLRAHMALHTGNKPYKCPHCDERFRIKQTLTYHLQRRHRTKEDTRNILKLHKCRICGKHDFVMFHELHSHRTRKHSDVPYDKEKEKPFACGICLKPFFLREDAVVCALLAHDVSQIHSVMFKYECSECPKDRLGFYKLAHLRKHWDDEHPEKTMPAQMRKGTNLDDGSSLTTLPYVRVNKVKAQEIRENGLPPGTSFECPLYFDLTEFGPSEEEEHWMASIMLEILGDKVTPSCSKDGPQICTICGETLSNRGNFKRHLTSGHISQEILSKEKEEEEEEQRDILEGRSLPKKNHRVPAKLVAPSPDEYKNIFQSVLSKKKEGNDEEEEDSGEDASSDQVEKEDDGSSFKCRFCDKSFNKKRALHFHEVRGHLNPPPSSESNVKHRKPRQNRALSRAFPSVVQEKHAARKRSRQSSTISRTSSGKHGASKRSRQSRVAPPSSAEEDSSSSNDSDLFQKIRSSRNSRKPTTPKLSVNINDSLAIARLLNHKTLKVEVSSLSSSDIDNLLLSLRNSSSKRDQRKEKARRRGGRPRKKRQPIQKKREVKPKKSLKKREVKTDNNIELRKIERPQRSTKGKRREFPAVVKNELVDPVVEEEKQKKPIIVKVEDKNVNKNVANEEKSKINEQEVVEQKISEAEAQAKVEAETKVEAKINETEKKVDGVIQGTNDEKVSDLIAKELEMINKELEQDFDEDDLDDIIAEELEEMMDEEFDNLIAEKLKEMSDDEDDDEDEEESEDEVINKKVEPKPEVTNKKVEPKPEVINKKVEPKPEVINKKLEPKSEKIHEVVTLSSDDEEDQRINKKPNTKKIKITQVINKNLKAEKITQVINQKLKTEKIDRMINNKKPKVGKINQVITLSSDDEDDEDDEDMDEFGSLSSDFDEEEAMDEFGSISSDVDEEEVLDDEEMIDDAELDFVPEEDPLGLDGEVAPCDLEYYNFNVGTHAAAPSEHHQKTNGTINNPSSISNYDHYPPVIHANKANVTIAAIKSPKVVLRKTNQVEEPLQNSKSLLCDRQSNNV